MAKDLEAPKPFVPSVFSDGAKLDAGNVEEMRFGLAGSGPLAKAVLDSNAVGTMRQLVGGGATPTTTIPVGTISPYGGTLAPANWLLCNGAPVSRNTYAALFDVTSTTYGVGDGSTTFNLPEFVGTYTKFIIKALPDVSNTFGVALSGVAGGMLSGTYPNPSVASISGLAAGGDLAGTYPNPTYKNYTICTSATRPASPFNGLQIFETDTQLLLLYVSGAWRINMPNYFNFVEGSTTNNTSTQSTAYVATPLQATITKAYSASKILISADCNVGGWNGNSSTDSFTSLRLIETGSSRTKDFLRVWRGYQGNNSIASTSRMPFQWLDTVSGTGSRTYRVDIRCDEGAPDVSEFNLWTNGICRSDIFLQEIF